MSQEDLEQIAKDRLDLSKLPSKLIAIIAETERKLDNKGKDCVYITFKITGEGELFEKVFTQKYSSMHVQDLLTRFDKLNIENLAQLKKQEWIYEKQDYNIGFARMMPVEQVQTT